MHRFIIVLGLGIGATAFGLRSTQVVPSSSVRIAGRSVEAEAIPVAEPCSSIREQDVAGSRVSPHSGLQEDPLTDAAETDSVRLEAIEEAQRKRERNLDFLHRELGLTQVQRQHVERVWSDRDAEVSALHSEIRASKVLWLWDHDRNARRILATSHALIAAALSGEQSRKFFEILESGRLAEGISFELTPDMTVVR